MSLSIDNTELGMLLPLRSGISIAEYQQCLAHEFAEGIVEHISAHICKNGAHDAVLFTADEDDDGRHLVFHGCEDESIIFSAAGSALHHEYYNVLMFLHVKNKIYMFFTNFKYAYDGRLYFEFPKVVYNRFARQNKRVRIDGRILLKRGSGQETHGDLYDFSPTGASFLTETSDFKVGESMLVEFDVPDCGKCETIATIVRCEVPSHRGKQWMVAVKMILGLEQRKKAEYLYLCKKGMQIKNMPDGSKSTHVIPFTISE